MIGNRPDLVALGLAIEDQRKEKGFTRPELAQISTLSYPYVYEIEKGKKDATRTALEKIAGALDVTPEALMDRAKELVPNLEKLLAEADEPKRRQASATASGVDRIVADVMKQIEPLVREAVERELRKTP